MPKVEKVLQYALNATELLRRNIASLKETASGLRGLCVYVHVPQAFVVLLERSLGVHARFL